MKLPSTLIIFSSFLAVASAATVPTTPAATVGAIMNDFTELSHLYAETVTALATIPQSGTQGANAIHDHETKIETIFAKVIDNLEILPQPVPDTTARDIIKKYQSFVPMIIESLNGIKAKASDFETMNSAPMMAEVLKTIPQPCAQFAELITAMTPGDMTTDVNTMFDQLTATRNDAAAALASVMGV